MKILGDKGLAVVVNRDTQNIRTIIVNKVEYFKKSDRFMFKEMNKND